MQLYTFFLLPALAVFIRAQEFNLNCTNAPQSCNNDCYAVYVAGSQFTLNWDMPSAAVENGRRTASGCTQGNGLSACGTSGIPPYNNSGDTCDEYPYASTTQGGTGAILRCVPLADNASEGGQLTNFFNAPAGANGCGGAPCQFTIFILTGTPIANSPFCMTETGPNDGDEFKLQNGQYVLAKKRRTVSSGYDGVQPDPALYIPLSQRREFLLDNGQTVLALTRDMEKQFDGSTVSGDDFSATIVRELFGNEKSEPFR